jgi:uncharacterized lipoprotein NlpE involved in copper resistance
MKNTLIKIIILSCATLTLLGCNRRNTSSNKATDTTNVGQLHSPFLDSLENAIYYNPSYCEYYQLHDGNYVLDTTYEMDSAVVHDVERVSFGGVLIENDFDNNGVDDALVGLSESSTGSGIFYSVALMLNRNNSPIYKDSKSLGDRIQIDSAAMAGDTICIYAIVQGPDEPMCCPTMPFVYKLIYNNGKLILLNEPR